MSKEAKDIKGQVVYVGFSLIGGEDTSFEVSLAYGEKDSYQVAPHAGLTWNGQPTGLPALLTEFGRAITTGDVVKVVLHDRENSYVRIGKADFTTHPKGG